MAAGRAGRGAAVVLLVALVAISLPSSAFGQCAMCKAALEGSTDGLGARFNRAILVMMAGPYLLMGVFGVMLFREHIRAAGRRVLGRWRRIAGPGSGR